MIAYRFLPNLPRSRGITHPVGRPVRGGLWFVALLIGLVLSFAMPATATEDSDLGLNVVVTVSSKSVQVAEPFVYRLSVTAPSGTQIVFPAIADRIGKFDVVDYQDQFDVPSADVAGQRTWKRQMTLESIETGELQIPAMNIVATRSGRSGSVNSRPVPVDVISVLEDRADPTQFRDIQSVVDVEIPAVANDRPVWRWVGIGVGGIALAVAALMLVIGRKTWFTPQQWAVQELGKLSDSWGKQKITAEQAVDEMSAILRDYLELQFEVSAPNQTTNEILAVFHKDAGLNESLVNQYACLFGLADQSKFAGLGLDEAEVTSSLADARELIVQTAAMVETNVSDSHGMANFRTPDKTNREIR